MTQRIFKICPAAEWHEAKTSGRYLGSADDLRDGFIHFSTAAQLAGTLAKHFPGQADLLLIAVSAAKLGEALKWEPARQGELFPHLYGSFDTDLAENVTALSLDDRDLHILPEGLMP